MDENRRDRKCDVTNKPIINDCSIRIEFGHPSDKNGDIYYLSVHDDIGKNVLSHISGLFTNGSNIEDHHIRPRGTWFKE